MKKILIGSLVGAIILFIWSFLAWALLPIHLHTLNYTPAQDSILKVLADNNLETGAYAMPMADNRNVHGFDKKFMEESEKAMKENAGMPMATIHYLKEGYDMSPGTMIRGFIFDFLAALAVCLLLAPTFAKMSSFFGRWWLMLLVGLLLACTGPLLEYNWMAYSWDYTVDMVLDGFLNWAITGLWFAWYFKN